MEPVKRPKKAMSSEDTKVAVIKILENLLDLCIVNQEQSSIPDFGSGRQIVFICNEDSPYSNGEVNVAKISSLLAQRMEQELDRVRYCIMTYNRALDGKHFLADPSLKEEVSSATQQAAAAMIVQILTEATCTQGDLDLFTSYEVTSGTHGDLATFLDCVLGWSSSKGMTITFPPKMLSEALKHAKSSIEGRTSIIELIKSISRDLKSINRLDEILTKGARSFESLRILLAEPSISEIVGERLLDEVKGCSKAKGGYFEKESVFGALLSLSTILPSLNIQLLHDSRFACFTSLRGFPTPLPGDFEQCQDSIVEAYHKVQSILHSSLRLQLKSPAIKNNVLSWMAAVVGMNEMRAGPKFELKKPSQLVASDGFFVNFCMVMLEFCRPFFCTHPSGAKLHLIAPDYPLSPVCRLDLQNEPCLASGMISSTERMSLDFERFLCLGGNFKFVTECFFITLRALHIGLLPATASFMKTLGDLRKEIDRKGQDKILNDLFGLALLSGTCCLLDQQLVQYVSEFYITQAVWIIRPMDNCQQSGVPESEVHMSQQKLFSSIPEHGVKDMVRWFLFVLRTRPKLLHGLQLTPVVDCCISLLERPDLLPGPVAQSLIISLLLACVGRDTGNPRQLLSTSSWGGVLGELSAIIQGSPAFQGRLGPALLQTYSAVGFFEGLDVDKEDFDKYAARYDIAQLLTILWGRMDCRESIVHQTGSKRFEDFLSAIFDTPLYQVNDSLLRITNIYKLEKEKENAEHWRSLSVPDKLRKEALLTGEQRAAKGFLKMGIALLQLLVSMTEVDTVSEHFCKPPLLTRTAAAVRSNNDN